MVAFILILSVLYQAWIRKIPVLAGVTIPALIMLLYAGWVLFLAKKDKQRRINAVSYTIYIFPPILSGMVESF